MASKIDVMVSVPSTHFGPLIEYIGGIEGAKLEADRVVVNGHGLEQKAAVPRERKAAVRRHRPHKKTPKNATYRVVQELAPRTTLTAAEIKIYEWLKSYAGTERFKRTKGMYRKAADQSGVALSGMTSRFSDLLHKGVIEVV